MTHLTLQQALDLARHHHQAGRLADAEQLYRQILAREPQNAQALHLLGFLAGQVARHDEAIDLIGQAIQIAPDNDIFYSNLADLYLKKGRPDDAIAVCRQALALHPNWANVHNILGNAHQANGQLDDAIAAYRQALALNPNMAEAYSNLSPPLQAQGQPDQAIAAARQAIALDPHSAQAHNNLGYALQANGQWDDAIAALMQALTLNPNLPKAHYNLGNALQAKGRVDDAIAAYRRALALNPKLAEAENNLGRALQTRGRLDDAVAAYHRALALNPNLPEAHNNLGSVSKDQGLLDDAIASFQRAFELNPSYAASQGNLIYTLQFHDACDASTLLRHAKEWNQRHALPLRKFIAPHPNDPSPDRRLRIGYISPDFRDHVVGWSLLPLLSHHDHAQLEIFCYADVARPTPMTDKIRACADVWRNITNLSDENIVELIRNDQINILVDLTLHMARNRLLVFARKPAPIQVTYLGYCGTTGLDTIDYRFSDPYLDPPGADLSCYSEQTIRLPQTYWCYEPSGAAPDVSPLPVLTTGHITFGCLNNFAKVSSAALDLWAQVLANVPHSRLILHAIPGNYLDAVRQRFARAGIAPDRLEFIPRQPWLDYMRTYHRIDIALDPFPYAGGITTCDALWMGAPIITLRGQTAVGRGGYSILSNLGLPDLVATTPDEYVRLATELANDPSRLIELRRTLRERMRTSPLMDAPHYAADVEAAYRQIWRQWCDAQRNIQSGEQMPPDSAAEPRISS